nr:MULTISPECIES: DUF503 domain-containing protein [Salisediminibacterium]
MIGTMIVEATLYEASSLKAKRSVVKSISTRIKQKYNVSIAETGHQEAWQRVQWSIVSVGNQRKLVEAELERSLALIESSAELEVIHVQREMV